MQPSTFYHIYSHANGSENLFHEADNYRFFLEKRAKYIEPVAATYAYCLMPNYIHFLISTEELVNLTGLGDLSGFEYYLI